MSHLNKENETTRRLGSNVFNIGASILLFILFFVGITPKIMDVSVSLNELSKMSAIIHLFWLVPVTLSILVFLKQPENKVLHLSWFGISAFVIGYLLSYQSIASAMGGLSSMLSGSKESGFNFVGYLYMFIWIFLLVWNLLCLLGLFRPLQLKLGEAVGSLVSNAQKSMKEVKKEDNPTERQKEIIDANVEVQDVKNEIHESIDNANDSSKI